MKKLSTALLAVAAVAANAQIKQTWSNTLYDENQSWYAADSAVSAFGQSYSLYLGVGTGIRILCHDGNGNGVWQRNYETYTGNRGARMVIDGANNLVVAFQDENFVTHVAKFDGAQGTLLWDTNLQQQSAILYASLKDMALDGSDNIVLLGTTTSGPVIQKLSPAGQTLQARTATSDTGGYQAEDLAVAANGQIYALMASPGFTTRRMEALTPNFSLRYAKTWPLLRPYSATVAADRNGRVCATELKNNETIVIRTFANTNGNPTVAESPVPGRNVVRVESLFDANLHLAIAGTRSEDGANQVFCEWYGVTDTTASLIRRAGTAVPGYAMPQRIVTDAFGQTYVAAAVGDESSTGMLFAFDENRVDPVWSFVEPNVDHSAGQMAAAVGRWGQLNLVTTLGDVTTYQGTSYIRQLGFRNLLINGQSFTGGRTITGTVNFYSNDGMDRSVAMTSNTSFATIAPTTTVTAGNSQATMSVDLKPTAIRRAVRIEGSFAGTKRSVVFYIEPPVASGLTVYPTSVKGGASVNGSARINGAAPAEGIVVNLTSNDTAAIVPSSVTVPEGAITKAFQVNTIAVGAKKTVILTATTGSVSKTALLTITP